MIIQLGNKNFNIGRIRYNSSSQWREVIEQGTFLSYAQIEKWSRDSRYCLTNPPLGNGFGAFLDSNDTVTEWFAYPFFDAEISGQIKTFYLIFYKVPPATTPPNQYPVGCWCLCTGYMSNNLLQFKDTGVSHYGNTLGYYTFVSPNEPGLVWYDYYYSNTGEYMYWTGIGEGTARASINSGIWTSGRNPYNVNEEPPWTETNTPIDKYLISRDYGLFGYGSYQISPPTGVELDLVDDPSSEAGGEDGTFYPYGDDINYPDLPTISGVSLGLVTLYKPTPQELISFAQWLYNTPFDDTIIDTLKKLNTDIFSYIIALTLLPISTTAVDATTFKMGPVDSEISTSKVLTQYITTPEYTKSIDEYYGGFQDYSPSTKVMLYIPFVGFKELSVDDVMAGNIGIKFNIDLLTGDIVAFVRLYGKYTNAVIYEYNGNCASQIPLNGRDYSAIVSGAIQGAVQTAQSAISGNIGAAVGQAVNTITDIATSKPRVVRSGTITGNAGFLSTYVPYLLFVRPAASHPQNYEKFKGRPSNITTTLGTLTGYTVVDSIINSGYSKASKSEIDAIDRLLREGVYL